MKPSVALYEHREAIRQLVYKHRASNPRVFGSVVHGNDSDKSDLDLLVDPFPETSLLDLACLQVELEALLSTPVDVVTPACLADKIRSRVLLEAQPI